ncbi:MAG: nitrous oxide-stimulated promoter family protein [Erysipelotrichaceae bacterium]
MHKMKNIIFITLGFIFFAIGWVGVILPVLPTTPFLLLATACFAKGSKRFHTWFLGTKLYQNHLEEFVTSRAMTLKTKVTILVPATLMLLLAYWMVPIVHAKYCILAVIMFKYYYFACRIKTIQPVEDRRVKEKAVVGEMVQIYCDANHEKAGKKKELCKECSELLAYAHKRIDVCPFMEEKTFCANCHIKCYQKDKQEEIRNVMKFAGKRMLFVRPWMAISHVFATLQEKRKVVKQHD